MSGKARDAGVEVALARNQLRRLGYRPEEVDTVTTETILLQTVTDEVIAARAAEDAKVAAWFQRAAKDATQIRIQPLPEVPDG